jgi:glycosyltransferase involved in cell wall biosynthesis
VESIIHLEMNRILFIVSEDWYFYSHRLYLAKIAIKLGYKVALLSHYTNHRDKIKQDGIEVINWPLNRSTKNLLQEIKAIKSVASSINNFQPSVIYAVAMKPVLYSAIACFLSGFKNRVFALAGLGFIFTSKKRSVKVLRLLMEFVFRLLFKGNNTRLILQNPEDQSALLSAKVINKNYLRLIRGAGVDTTSFHYQKIPNEIPVIILPARMLWAKGIQDFVDCAIEINKKVKKARFVLVGTPDIQNPDAIPKVRLKKWNEEGVIEWWGHQSDMVIVYHQSTIVCLPTTYGEGLPKSLLEAASCGRPIVAYDVPGCREIVQDGYNGYLVKPKSINGLVDAITKILNSYELCVQMGKNGRQLVKKHFTQEKIARETMAVWEEVLIS